MFPHKNATLKNYMDHFERSDCRTTDNHGLVHMGLPTCYVIIVNVVSHRLRRISTLRTVTRQAILAFVLAFLILWPQQTSALRVIILLLVVNL